MGCRRHRSRRRSAHRTPRRPHLLRMAADRLGGQRRTTRGLGPHRSLRRDRRIRGVPSRAGPDQPAGTVDARDRAEPELRRPRARRLWGPPRRRPGLRLRNRRPHRPHRGPGHAADRPPRRIPPEPGPHRHLADRVRVGEPARHQRNPGVGGARIHAAPPPAHRAGPAGSRFSAPAGQRDSRRRGGPPHRRPIRVSAVG